MPEPTDGIDSGSDSGPDSSPDSDSEDSDDETTTWKPTKRPSGTSGGIGPSQTASDPLSASTTGSRPDPEASAEAAKVAEMRHHQEVETALIVVGVVGKTPSPFT